MECFFIPDIRVIPGNGRHCSADRTRDGYLNKKMDKAKDKNSSRKKESITTEFQGCFPGIFRKNTLRRGSRLYLVLSPKGFQSA